MAHVAQVQVRGTSRLWSLPGVPHSCLIMKDNRKPSVGFQEESEVETEAAAPPRRGFTGGFAVALRLGLCGGWAAGASADGQPPLGTAHFPRHHGGAVGPPAISPSDTTARPHPGPSLRPCQLRDLDLVPGRNC